MPLSKNLISQFVKSTTDNKKNNKETFVQGNIVQNRNGQYCVKLHNDVYGEAYPADVLYIPVKITTNVNINQPVTVMIKNHSATVIGNVAEVAKDSSGEILNNTASLSVETVPIEDIEALWDNYFNS